MPIFRGSATALITPFAGNEIDFDAFGRIIEFQLAQGTDALLVCGTTGEPSTMTEAEKRAAIEFVIKRTGGRVPVIAGTGSNNTASAVSDSIAAEKLGADALLVVTPYYNKCTQKGLILHFNAIADAVNIPIILYNVPARTGVKILPQTCKTLAQHKNIVALKEASGDIEQISEVARLCEGKLDIYSGDDGLIVPVMALGGLGVISVAANIIPRAVSELTASCLSGDFAAARKKQFEINPLVRALFCEVNPIPVKTAAALMGLCESTLRPPLCEMDESNLALLSLEMKKLEESNFWYTKKER